MVSPQTAQQALDMQPGNDELHRAQLTSFARQTPINICVTIAITLLLAWILWPVAPRGWLVLWAGTHTMLSLLGALRWWNRRHRRRRRQPSQRGALTRSLRRAKLWALSSGALWGVGAAFLPVIPLPQQLAVIIVIAAMSAGASTTLAAIPQAASLYILSSTLPSVIYFLLRAEPIYFGLAAMALTMTTAMLVSSRVVYGTFLEELRAKQTNTTLLAQFHTERQEWLDISETTEAFALFDAEDQLLLWNESYLRVLGLPPDSIARGTARIAILRHATHLMDTSGNTSAQDAWIEAQLHMHEHPDEPLVQQLPPGRWLRSTARRTSHGHLVTMHVDITERTLAEEERERLTAQLHQAQKMEALGTLAGGIAHEFNNLLGVIIGFAELIQWQAPVHSTTQHDVQELLKAGHRAKELVQQILAFSRHTEAERTPTALHTLVHDALQLLRAPLPSTISIREKCDSDVGMALVNATQMHQVVMNLCSNAEYAMRTTVGVLEIELDAVEVDAAFAAEHPPLMPGSHARLTVRDTGKGMSPDVITRIFDPFYTTKEVGEGTGLGLAIVHGIVLDHGGALTVESALGIGTTFCVYLPLLHDVPPVEVVAPEPLGQGNGRILFVDDEDQLVQVVQTVLTTLGYDSQAVNSSRVALELFRKTPDAFDLVITDQTMPDLPGEALIHELRRIRADIPLILTTGYSHVMNAAKAQCLGIDAFLPKPFSIEELGHAIQQALPAATDVDHLPPGPACSP
jgi:signal transduction histidine kinase/CheY-like chemotaxis protein